MKLTRRIISVVLAVLMLMSLSVVAVSAATKHTITFNSCIVLDSSNNIVTEASAGEILKAVPATKTGYRFTSWQVEVSGSTDVFEDTSNPLRFTMPPADFKITALYEKVYNVTATDCEVYSGDTLVTVAAEGEALTVVPKKAAYGYEIKKFEVTVNDGVDEIYYNDTFEYTMPAADVEIKTVYTEAKALYLMVEYNPNTGGSSCVGADFQENGSIYAGYDYSFMIGPEKGYTLTEEDFSFEISGNNYDCDSGAWTYNSDECIVTIKGEYITGNITVHAKGQRIVYQATAEKCKIYYADVEVSEAAYKSIITLVADEAPAHHKFSGWKVVCDGVEVSVPDSNPLNTSMPAGDTTFTALYEEVWVAPELSGGILNYAIVGEAYAEYLSAGDDAYPSVSFSLAEGSQLPEGLTFDYRGIISGVPETEGTYVFDVNANSMAGDDTATYQIDVVSKMNCYISEVNIPAGVANTDIEPIDLSGWVNGGTGKYLVEFAEDTPSWLQYNPETGMILGTRPAEAADAVITSFKVVDLSGQSAEVVLNVGEVVAEAMPVAVATVEITVPVPGETPSSIIAIPEDAEYNATLLYWYDKETGFVVTEAFQAGKTYSAEVAFIFNEAYPADENTKFLINGVEAYNNSSIPNHWIADFLCEEPVVVTGIGVNSTEHMTECLVGDAFSCEGLTIAVNYSDGTSETVAVDSEMLGAVDTSEAGVKTVEIFYGEFSTSFELTVKEPTIGLLGDANEDGTVNVRDATLIQKHVASIVTLSETALILSDVNGDGKVNVKDATAIQKYVASIETGYPIGQPV